ncbi:MAG: hypothetical protein JSV07_07265 [Acidimicrobiia bacterium]|nr:MAG: hypothetical protein JSV07_07265 [Acidimicrobiia bacterium]
MRLFEGLLVALLAVGFALPSGRARLPWALAALLTVGTQVWLEGWRWQLVPASILVGILLARSTGPSEADRPAWRMTAISLVVALVAGTLPALLPVPDLPTPDGPYAVGTTSFELTDPDRLEPYGSLAGEPRRIMVQAWYPADQPGEAVAWTPEIASIGPVIAEQRGLPSFLFSHTRYVEATATEGATVLEGAWPVVVYSHGWTGFRTVAPDQAEAIASHGFIVLAPDHTHGAVATTLADGTTVTYDPNALPEFEEVGETAYVAATELLVETYAADIGLVLDALAEGSAPPELAAASDLESVGVFGHSTGGGAAARFCLEDTRCDALVGLDAWVEPIPEELRAKPMAVPARFLRSEGWTGTPNDELLGEMVALAPASDRWSIPGAEHNDFTFVAYVFPIAHYLGLRGPIDSDTIIALTNGTLTGFFGHHLAGEPEPLDPGLPAVGG